MHSFFGIHEDVELRLLEGDLHEWIIAARDEDGSFVAGTALRATTRALDEVPLLEFSAKVRLTDEDIRHFIPSLGIQPLIAFRRVRRWLAERPTRPKR